MKRELLLMALSILCLVGINAQQLNTLSPNGKQFKAIKLNSDLSEDGTSMKFGYCSDVIADGLGQSSTSTLKAAIYIPADELKELVGSEITQLHIGLTNYSFSNAIIFIASEEFGEPFYTQQVNLIRNQWNQVTLETSLLIEEGKNYFIGYQVTISGAAYPVGIDAGPAHQYGDYFAVGDTWYHLAEIGYSNNVSILITVEGDNLPQNEINFFNIESLYYADIKDKYEIKGSLKNLGAQNLSSFEVQYQIGDFNPIVESFNNLNIANYSSYEFSIGNITLEDLGYYDLTVKILSINGVNYESELSKKITIYSADNNNEVRKILLEHFTTAQCPNCPLGHTRVKNALSTRSNIIWVAHHSGYGEDAYTIQANRDYLWFFNSNRIYAPGAMLDRRNMVEYSPNTNSVYSPVFSVNSTDVGGLLDIELDFPPFVTIDLEKEYNEETRILELKVTSNTIQNMVLGEDVRINIFLTEDGLKGSQAGATGTYTHDHVVREVVVGGSWGDSIVYNDNGLFAETFTIPISGSYVADNVNVVVFISNYDSIDPNNSLIYNAEAVELIQSETSLEDNQIDNVIIYTQNSSITVEGDFLNGAIYDVTGKLVKQFSKDQNTFTLNGGVYIVKINNSQNEIVQKVIIK